jgi:hypothetical protein
MMTHYCYAIRDTSRAGMPVLCCGTESGESMEEVGRRVLAHKEVSIALDFVSYVDDDGKEHDSDVIQRIRVLYNEKPADIRILVNPEKVLSGEELRQMDKARRDKIDANRGASI